MRSKHVFLLGYIFLLLGITALSQLMLFSGDPGRFVFGSELLRDGRRIVFILNSLVVGLAALGGVYLAGAFLIYQAKPSRFARLIGVGGFGLFGFFVCMMVEELPRQFFRYGNWQANWLKLAEAWAGFASISLFLVALFFLIDPFSSRRHET